MMLWKDLDQSYADAAVKASVDHYHKLPKTGKPTKEEWTILATIVEDDGEKLRVVALGTGSKCVGEKSLSPRGDILHDAHAEVVARRGFLLYLLDEIRRWHQTGSSRAFEGLQDGCLTLKDSIRYCFVVSAVPCGDAAIIPMTEASYNMTTRKRKMNPEDSLKDTIEMTLFDNSVEEPRRGTIDGLPAIEVVKKPRVALDVHRTGAKCLLAAKTQDPKRAGVDYHVTGQVRTKPGRGDPTVSVSCSDKLARWNAVGLQGALISLLVAQPVHFSSIVIAGGVPFSEETLERAINGRIGQPGKVRLLQSSVPFPDNRSDTRIRPAACSIAWSLPTNKVQVCVEGRRLGATKAKPSRQSAVPISKVSLHSVFLQVLPALSVLPPVFADRDFKKLTYRQLKDSSKTYQESWKLVKDEYFKIWTQKPTGLEDFHA